LKSYAIDADTEDKKNAHKSSDLDERTETSDLLGDAVRLGLGLDRVLDLLDDLGRELGDDGERGQVVVELLDRGRAEDDGRNVLVVDAPGDGELGEGRADLVRDLLELVGELDLVLVRTELDVGKPLVVGEAVSYWFSKSSTRKNTSGASPRGRSRQSTCR